MKRSGSVVWRAAGVAVAAALALTGCADPEGPTGDYDELCVNEETQERVPDDWCEDGPDRHGGHGFVYVPYHYGRANPAYPIGSKVTGASSIKPSTGTFVRGGFGGVRGGTSGG